MYKSCLAVCVNDPYDVNGLSNFVILMGILLAFVVFCVSISCYKSLCNPQSWVIQTPLSHKTVYWATILMLYCTRLIVHIFAFFRSCRLTTKELLR